MNDLYYYCNICVLIVFVHDLYCFLKIRTTNLILLRKSSEIKNHCDCGLTVEPAAAVPDPRNSSSSSMSTLGSLLPGKISRIRKTSSPVAPATAVSGLRNSSFRSMSPTTSLLSDFKALRCLAPEVPSILLVWASILRPIVKPSGMNSSARGTATERPLIMGCTVYRIPYTLYR